MTQLMSPPQRTYSPKRRVVESLTVGFVLTAATITLPEMASANAIRTKAEFVRTIDHSFYGPVSKLNVPRPHSSAASESSEEVVLNQISATRERLDYLEINRVDFAGELEIAPVPLKVFQEVRAVLESTSGPLEQIRIGFSCVEGLELRLPSADGLKVATFEPGTRTLEHHSGKNHQVLKSGDISDAEVVAFFGGAE